MDIYQQVIEWIDRGEPFALAVILRAKGSAPQRDGVRAIIDASGKIHGTLGGGLVEAEAQKRGAEACRAGRAHVFDYRLDNASASDAGAICGGVMRILLDGNAARHRAGFARAAAAIRERSRGVLLTMVKAVDPVDVSVEWFAEGAIPSKTGFPAADVVGSCLSQESPRLLVDEPSSAAVRHEVFVEPVIAKPKLLIAGGGHVGRALAHQAVLIGFDVTVIDDRPEFTDPAVFPDGVTTRCGDIAQLIADCPVDRGTYVVIVTRGHQRDQEVLEACIHAPSAYIGMIGSKRKVAMVRERLVGLGRLTEEEFGRVFTPIGMDIGGITVPEIAVSIAAELIAVRRLGREAASSGGRIRP